MSRNLKLIYNIQKTLDSEGYFDISRISNEIYDYCNGKSNLIEKVLKRIVVHEPWEYIRGYTEFCTHRFLVNQNTLIPRIETEQLVDIAVSIVARENISKVIDVGTGSGCIIISIALACKEKIGIEYCATDISKEALDLAQYNASNNDCSQILFKQSNLIDEIEIDNQTLIVANLPYIPSKIYENLDESVKNYEPKLALEAGEDGIKYYTQLIDEIRKRKCKVILLIEIDPSITKNLREYLYEDTLLIKDLRNLDRFLLIRF